MVDHFVCFHSCKREFILRNDLQVSGTQACKALTLQAPFAGEDPGSSLFASDRMQTVETQCEGKILIHAVFLPASEVENSARALVGM